MEEIDFAQELTAPSDGMSLQQIFIVLPFDDGLYFQSVDKLERWIVNEIKLFEVFLDSNKLQKNVLGSRTNTENLPKVLLELIRMYEKHYKIVYDRVIEVCQLIKMNELDALENKKENLIRAWADFTSAGLVPMTSSIGECALAMSNFQNSVQPKSSLDSYEPRISLTWLTAMTALRKQQTAQLSKLPDIKTKIKDNRELLVSLEEDIKNGQDKIKLYEKNIEDFQDNVLKASALKAPADALDVLEKGHRNTALGYFGLIAAIVSVWISFVIFCYYPTYVKPLLDKAKDAPLEVGAMILTSMVFTGIVLTVVIILLRLAVSRINFSIAAGERKAMAAAYRALLDENAIPKDQQHIFLQGIVGGNFPGYVDSNRIPTIQDSLGTAARNLRGGNAKG